MSLKLSRCESVVFYLTQEPLFDPKGLSGNYPWIEAWETIIQTKFCWNIKVSNRRFTSAAAVLMDVTAVVVNGCNVCVAWNCGWMLATVQVCSLSNANSFYF